MARFNTSAHQTKPPVATTTSPLSTVSQQPDTRTALGAAGWTRTPKGELFLMSSGALLDGKDHMHELGEDRDNRFSRLVRTVAMEDPEWTADLLGWLRGDGNIRTAALVGGAEFTAERLRNKAPGSRHVIDSVLRRADEPAEMIAYWTSQYGRAIPKPVKRGVADAVRRLYTGKSLLKYDATGRAIRFGDVLNLVHAKPDPNKPWQGDVFQYALDRRHHPDTAVPPASNRTLTAHKKLMELPVGERRATVTSPNGSAILAEAGMTWETLAGWLQGPMDKEAWEAVIPSMGVMAQIRNLRNFDQVGVSDDVAEQIVSRLTDADTIASSRQLPFRFLSAYRATKDAGSLRWSYPLEKALGHSLANVPSLPGRTLILVDRSPSMFPEYNHMFPDMRMKDISRADQAALFGSALAVRAKNPTLVEFHGTSREIPVGKGTSVLPLVEKFGMDWGTNIPAAVSKHYKNHDRIVIITDEQTQPGYLPSNEGGRRVVHTRIDAVVPLNVPVYMWNFAGYTASAMPSGSNARFTLGGLSDQAFKMIPMLESGSEGVWPWHAVCQGD